MRGWKTWMAAGFVVVAAVVRFFGYEEISDLLLCVGGSFGLIGLGHKIEKNM